MTTDTTADASTETQSTPTYVRDVAHFERTVGASDVVLVDFFATWCGPCQMLEPILEELASTTGAHIAKVDVDQHQELAREYGVQGVPTMVLFVDGEPTHREVGLKPIDQLKALIAEHATK